MRRILALCDVTITVRVGRREMLRQHCVARSFRFAETLVTVSVQGFESRIHVRCWLVFVVSGHDTDSQDRDSPLCISICVLAGTLAGAWMGYQLGYRRAGVVVWLSTVSVALIIAALGSLDVGLISSIGLSTAYIATGALVAALVRLRSAAAI